MLAPPQKHKNGGQHQWVTTLIIKYEAIATVEGESGSATGRSPNREFAENKHAKTVSEAVGQAQDCKKRGCENENKNPQAKAESNASTNL